MKPSINAVIRTYNEEKFIGQLIRNLRVQSEYCQDLEIVVVDSGSTDRTKEIVSEYDAVLINIAKEEFNWSRALNLGISRSRGDFVVILSAHAIPTDNQWLAKMLTHFQQQNVAGVYCKQIPWPDANLFEIARLKKTFPDTSTTYDSVSSEANMNFSNAASCIRRTAWKQHPFVIMPAAEDGEWANWAISHGYKIAYDSSAQVYHSHSESSRKTAERIIDIERAADIRNHRKRHCFLTVKQSIGWFVREFKEILPLRESKYGKLIHLKHSAAKSFWYAYDFNRKN